MKKYVGKMVRNSKQKKAKKKEDYYNKENDKIKKRNKTKMRK